MVRHRILALLVALGLWLSLMAVPVMAQSCDPHRGNDGIDRVIGWTGSIADSDPDEFDILHAVFKVKSPLWIDSNINDTFHYIMMRAGDEQGYARAGIRYRKTTSGAGPSNSTRVWWDYYDDHGNLRMSGDLAATGAYGENADHEISAQIYSHPTAFGAREVVISINGSVVDSYSSLATFEWTPKRIRLYGKTETLGNQVLSITGNKAEASATFSIAGQAGFNAWPQPSTAQYSEFSVSDAVVSVPTAGTGRWTDSDC